MTPCVVAEMTVEFDVAIPTCDAPGPFALKNTRSPAWMFARDTGAPTPNCGKLVRGSDDAGLPERVDDEARAVEAAGRCAAVDVRRADLRAGRARPPSRRRRRRRAARRARDPQRAERRRPDHAVDLEPVRAPGTPSPRRATAGRRRRRRGCPSFCWTAIVTLRLGFGPALPLVRAARRRRRRAPPRVIGPTIPSTSSPLRAWKAMTAALRLPAEDPVRGDARAGAAPPTPPARGSPS